MDTHSFAAGPSGNEQGWWNRRPNSFFSSIRNSGWFRPQSRTVGGVCAALARRWAIDPTITRGLTVVLAIFVPPVWMVYGLAWLLLPEERDGRIHLDELLHGHFDVAQLGAAVFALVGLTYSAPVGMGLVGWSAGTTGGALVLLATLLLCVGVPVAFIVLWLQRRGPGSPWQQPGPAGASAGPANAASGAAPWQAAAHSTTAAGTGTTAPGSSSPASSAEAGAATASTTDWRTQGGPVKDTASAADSAASNPWRAGATPSAAPSPSAWSAPGAGTGAAGATAPTGAPSAPSSATWQRPVIQALRPRRLPAWVNLAVTGLVIVGIAATCLGIYHITSTRSYPDAQMQSAVAMLIGGGACLVLVGFVIAVAAFRDRSAGWLIALSLVGLFLALPTLVFGVSAREDAQTYFSGPVFDEPATQDLHVDETTPDDTDLGMAVGQASVDVTQISSDETRTYPLGVVYGDLTIDVRAGQPVHIVVESAFGDVTGAYTDTNEIDIAPLWVPDEEATFSTQLDFQSPQFTEGAPGITINVSEVYGSINVVVHGSPVEDLAEKLKEQGTVPRPDEPSTRETPQSTGTSAAAPLGGATAAGTRTLAAAHPSTGTEL